MNYYILLKIGSVYLQTTLSMIQYMYNSRSFQTSETFDFVTFLHFIYYTLFYNCMIIFIYLLGCRTKENMGFVGSFRNVDNCKPLSSLVSLGSFLRSTIKDLRKLGILREGKTKHGSLSEAILVSEGGFSAQRASIDATRVCLQRF